MQIEEQVPLAPLTTIGIGGPARYFVRAESADDVREGILWARGRDLPVFVLGGGSNLLIADHGFGGLVLRLEMRGVTVESSDRDFEMIKVAAGEPWDQFVAFSVGRGLAGIECLSGIPGSTGATPIQNVGAYGQEVSETIVRVEAFDRTTSLVVWFTNEECRFGYRSSLFKTLEPNRYVVLSVTYRLRRGGEAVIGYPELRKALDERNVAPSDLRAVREAVIAIRKRKGMVIDPADSDTRSDGSFFMNPVLTDSDYAKFAAIAPEAPHFPSPSGVKLSAAWLIEHAGFSRGFAHGKVGLSTKHTLAIVNRGEGTAAEVVELVRLIQDRVREHFGVELHPEPVFVGF